MTRQAPEIVKKIVLVFDICSSTSILEDLKQTDNLEAWRELLDGMRFDMVAQHSEIDFEIYKFIGDGWIVLFPYTTTTVVLCKFLCLLSALFEASYTSIKMILQKPPKKVGLTFGIDKGDLIKFQMDGRIEYVGRALNVASRLQGAIPGNSCYMALASKTCFHSLLMGSHSPEDGIEFMRFQNVTVSLKNVAGGEEFEGVMWKVI
jgi:class 3 adenylate cyclase